MATGISISGTVGGMPRYVNVAGLSPSTVYKWSLRQVCTGGNSLSSDTITFTTKHTGYSARNENDEEVDDAISLYPNPAKSELNVAFTSSAETVYQINVKDVSGKLISTERFNALAGEQNNKIDVRRLSGGLYFIEMENKSEVKRLKFIVQQ